MIGVVVWSNADREKAVIWCEDHASLAYLQGRQNLSAGDVWPSPGDLLELETIVVGNLRHARNVSMVSEQSRTQLPTLLRDTTQPPQPHLKLVSNTDVASGSAPDGQKTVAAPVRIGAAR